MAGNLPGFKPHHRLSAAKELLRRGFDTPVPLLAPVTQPLRNPMWPQTRLKEPKRRPMPGSAPGWAATPTTPWTIIATKGSTGPFSFDSYDDEDYYFDCDGAYARHYVFGGKEATSAVHKTLYEFRSDARKIAKATGQDPSHCDHLIKVPADSPQPEDIYGYQALRWICYSSEQAARVAAWAAAQYHREQAALAGEDYPALRPRPHDGPRATH